MMFRETEVIPTRLQMLKSAQGKTLLDLLVVITCDADVPSTYLNRNLNNQPEEDECQSSTDTDVGVELLWGCDVAETNINLTP